MLIEATLKISIAIMSPLPLGRWATSWFTGVSCHPNVSWRPSVWAHISVTAGRNYVPPCPWDEGWHLELLWFPVTQMCVIICPAVRVSASVCARLCLHDISYRFSPMAFKFSDMVAIDKTLNWLTFVTMAQCSRSQGSLCFKINFVYAICLTVFCQWLSNSQIWWPWTRPWID